MGLHPGPERFIEALIVNFLLGFLAAWRQKAPEGSESGLRGGVETFLFAFHGFVCVHSLNAHRPSPPRQHNYIFRLIHSANTDRGPPRWAGTVLGAGHTDDNETGSRLQHTVALEA